MSFIYKKPPISLVNVISPKEFRFIQPVHDYVQSPTTDQKKFNVLVLENTILKTVAFIADSENQVAQKTFYY